MLCEPHPPVLGLGQPCQLYTTCSRYVALPEKCHRPACAPIHFYDNAVYLSRRSGPPPMEILTCHFISRTCALDCKTRMSGDLRQTTTQRDQIGRASCRARV